MEYGAIRLESRGLYSVHHAKETPTPGAAPPPPVESNSLSVNPPPPGPRRRPARNQISYQYVNPGLFASIP